MITTYRSLTGTFVASNGGDVSPQDTQLNILIELRVHSAILLGQQNGLVTDSLAQLRSDAVNDSVNLAI